jgi:hypothetical protein
MENSDLNKLRALYSGKIHQLNELIERVRLEGIEPFIANVEQCRSNLVKAEADLKAVCALVGIGTEGDVAAFSVEQAESKKPGSGGYIPSERILAAVSAILSAEPHKSFSLGELEAKTSFTNVQVRKEVKKLVKDGKVAEATDPNAKRRGFPTKIYTWKS